MSKEDLERWVVYVVNLTTGGTQAEPPSSVVMLDARDLSILRSARKLGPGATRLALSSDGNRLWVSHPAFGANRISVLDAATLDVIEVIDLGSAATITQFDHRPYGIAARENQVLVSYANSDMVGVYHSMTCSRLRTIPVSVSGPRVIVLTPDGEKAYVVNRSRPQEIAVIQCDSSQELTTIDLSGAYQLQEAVVSPDGTTLYVTDRRRVPNGAIHVISTSRDQYLDTIQVDPSPRAIGISPDGAYLFVGHDGRPSSIKMLRASYGPLRPIGAVVATATLAEPGTIVQQQDGSPRTMAVTPTGNRIFVVDHGTHKCYAFDVDLSPGGASLSRAAVVDLNIVPGYNASPVEVVIGQRLTPP